MKLNHDSKQKRTACFPSMNVRPNSATTLSTSTSVVNSTEGESGGLEASLSVSTGSEVSESAATTTGVATEASTEAVVTAGSETAVLGEVLPDLLLLILAF
ncbi:hypothetical protein [Ensifer sp. 4252]|uniref:hypothetical protein n=1 Tax=Ensifer sp. 4252 TaxID=3373915 RepID=UPI003D1AA732